MDMDKISVEKENRLKKAHAFYIELANYLRPAFENMENGTLQHLAEASYRYFRFLLVIDSLFDGDEDVEPIKLFEQIQSYEEAIKILSMLFSPIQDEGIRFWQKFNERKQQYLKTIMLERRLSKDKENIPLSVFLEIAVGKSAVCYAMVDAMAVLANDHKYEEDLKNCLKYIHIGFQYLDDLDDFKKDLQTGQHTFIISNLKGTLEQHQIMFSIDDELNYKYLFITETAQNNIKGAIESFSKAQNIAVCLGLDELKVYLDNEIEQSRHRLQEIGLLLDKARHKAVRSEKKLGGHNIDAEAVDRARRLSFGFLRQKQEKDGSFSDFLTKAGFGKIWVSAYVGRLLAEVDKKSDVVMELIGFFDKCNISLASFNETIFADGDSSNFLAGFNHYIGRSIDITEWIEFYDNGGWSTYKDAASLRSFLNIREVDADVSGWLSPQTCVSAAATCIAKDIADCATVFAHSAEYLLSKQQEKGQWEAYWWTSHVYSTSFAILALNGVDDLAVFKACEWLVAEKGNFDYWINPATGNPSPFYTALALKGLFAADRYAYNESIYRGVLWLMDQQYDDGSWFSDRILRIPPPHVYHPDKEVRQWKHANFGTGVIVDDHNRIFTTATVYNFLAHYQGAYVA